MHKPTVLNCTSQTAMIAFILIGLLFCLAGCAQLYKFVGLTEEQTSDQLDADRKTIIRTVTQVRTTAAEIITTSIAGLGAILSGFLAKWLGTERKLTKAMITGIESAASQTVKQSIEAKATASGVETLLHKRVTALT